MKFEEAMSLLNYNKQLMLISKDNHFMRFVVENDPRITCFHYNVPEFSGTKQIFQVLFPYYFRHDNYDHQFFPVFSIRPKDKEFSEKEFYEKLKSGIIEYYHKSLDPLGLFFNFTDREPDFIWELK